MKYQYFYQTKENENRSGWIAAKDRADAYTQLRRQGIRPYRVKGDDPVRWQPWALGGTIAALALALVCALAFGRGASGRPPQSRRQLTGERGVISRGLENGWEGVFATRLDRYLAAYAQPGWIAIPPEVTPEQVAAFAQELAAPLVYGDAEAPEVVQLKDIVAGMRAEMKAYLDQGGSVADYLRFLENRQDDERAFRNQARDRIARAPESMRAAYRRDVNVRLREMGLAEIAE